MNFVPLPKNASMAVCSALCLQHQHIRASEVPGPRWAIVRNPYDRMLSAYSFGRTVNFTRVVACMGGAETFADFLRLPGNALTHSQSYWLDAPIDLLLRFEDLPQAVEARFGIELPVINDNERVTDYDDETRALVAARYAEDFERFGYVV